MLTWLRSLFPAVSLFAFMAFAVPAVAQTFGNTDYTTAIVKLTAAGAGTTDSADLSNPYGRGVTVVTNISAKSGTIAVTVSIQGKDRVSGAYYTICSTPSLTTTGTTVLSVYPGMAVSANVSCSAPLPPTWRVEVVSGTGVTPSVTLTVGAGVTM